MNIAIAVTGDGAMVAGGDNWWKTSGQTGIFGPFPGEQDQTSEPRLGHRAIVGNGYTSSHSECAVQKGARQHKPLAV